MDNQESLNDFAKDMDLFPQQQDNSTDISDLVEHVDSLADTDFLTEMQRHFLADPNMDWETKTKLALQIEDRKHQYKHDSISWVIQLQEARKRTVNDKRLQRFWQALLKSSAHYFLYTQEGRTQLIHSLTSAKKILKLIIEAA